jgi:hypothetical protein
MREFFKQLLSGKDNQTHDIGRWSWLVTTLSVIAGGAWNAIHSGALDLAAFSQAVAVVVGAHGATLWAKRDTEPGDK